MMIISKKIILAVMVFGVVFAMPVKAETADELTAKINALKSELAKVQGSPSTSVAPASCANITFTKTLQLGSSGNDVKCLQTLLNQDVATQIALSGPGSVGKESTYFGRLSQQALIKFQQKYAAEILTPSGLVRGSGTVDVATALKLNNMLIAMRIPVAPIILTPPPLTTTAAIAKVNPAVVSIVISKEAQEYEVVYEGPFTTYRPTGRIVNQNVGAGTGVLITSDGYLITNNHVIIDPTYRHMVKFTDGSSYQAQVIHQNASNDVAILKIDGSNYPVANLGESNNLQLGQTVIAIGNALGEFSNTVSVGIVSGLNRNIQATDKQGNVVNLQNIIQTDAAINVGNSGGPLLDLNGNVIGINVATVQGSSNISFALPISPIKTVIKNTIGR